MMTLQVVICEYDLKKWHRNKSDSMAANPIN